MQRFRVSGRSGIRPAIVAAFVAMLLAPQAAAAQGIGLPGGALVTTNMSHSLSVFHPGSTGYVAITATIAEGWHINANKPLESYLIPSVLDVRTSPGIEIVRILYPAPVMKKLEVSETKMALYDGVVVFGAIVRIGQNVQPGAYRISATLRYQGCNNLTCVEPSSATADDTLRVGTMSETVEQVDETTFNRPPFIGDDGREAGVEASPAGAGDFGKMVAERGLALAFLAIFFGGLALNLTPCIYPLIPITISYFGGQAGGRTSRAFLLALLYVLGMSITYSVLGTIAAMTGSLFGAALQNPFVVLFLAAVLIILAFSMFGLWEIRMPIFLARRTGTARRGYAGAVIMGLTMGIVAAPCIGPFVLALLTYVGQMGKPVLGFLMFFTLAWGIGVPFLILGTLSGSISKLPRSGNWMVWVRKIFGFILLAMALYFVRNLLGPKLTTAGYAVVAIVGGIYLGWIDRAIGAGRGFKTLKRAVGIAGLALGVALLVVPALRGGAGEKPRGIAWLPFNEPVVANAAHDGKPVVIDFTATWCYYCGELDKRTFSDPEVMKIAKRLITLRVDLTKSDPAGKNIENEYNVRGLPAIIFIDASGAENKGLRVQGFIEAREFRKRLEALTGGRVER
ncbi:MAG TPA: cytochrome c biogenesis protein CcdA [Candidatus Krumholzibacteriaceae bacterium]